VARSKGARSGAGGARAGRGGSERGRGRGASTPRRACGAGAMPCCGGTAAACVTAAAAGIGAADAAAAGAAGADAAAAGCCGCAASRPAARTARSVSARSLRARLACASQRARFDGRCASCAGAPSAQRRGSLAHAARRCACALAAAHQARQQGRDGVPRRSQRRRLPRGAAWRCRRRAPARRWRGARCPPWRGAGVCPGALQCAAPRRAARPLRARKREGGGSTPLPLAHTCAPLFRRPCSAACRRRPRGWPRRVARAAAPPAAPRGPRRVWPLPPPPPSSLSSTRRAPPAPPRCVRSPAARARGSAPRTPRLRARVPRAAP
jgi:hypothetical protein